MANFEEHLAQAKRNLAFLGKINKQCNDHWDWQVTSCFYVVVHLANAHLARVANLHYRTHQQVEFALNPLVPTSISKIDEREFKAYKKLNNLSRRSRYLCHDSETNMSIDANFTYDVHFYKALKNLDIFLDFFSTKYSVEFDKLGISCLLLSQNETNYFYQDLLIPQTPTDS